jgi:hypothetical protein
MNTYESKSGDMKKKLAFEEKEEIEDFADHDYVNVKNFDR